MKLTKEMQNLAFLINKETPITNYEKAIIRDYGIKGLINSRLAMQEYIEKQQENEEIEPT